MRSAKAREVYPMAMASSTEDAAVREPNGATAVEDSPRPTTHDAYLDFRSAVLDPLRLPDGLRVRSYDLSLVLEAMATSARVLAPDAGPG
jgi:hypothetical protein